MGGTPVKLYLYVEKVDLGQRLKGWSVPESKYRSGVFAKYAAQVQSASQGAVTRP